MFGLSFTSLKPCLWVLALSHCFVSLLWASDPNEILITSDLPLAHEAFPELTTGQVTVIDRDDFNSGQNTVADVLENAPGVQVQQTGELGSFATVTVRGAPSNQTLVFVDGLLVSGGAGETVNLSQFHLSDVEKIEIYRTAPPGQLAQSSIGGAINIVTRKQSSVSTWAKVSAGSFGHTSVSGRIANSTSWIALDWLQSENDFPFVNNNGTPENPYDDEEQTRRNAQFDSQQFSAGHRLQFGQNQLAVSGRFQHRQKNLPTWNNSEVINTWYQQDFTELNGLWNWAGADTVGVDSSTRLSWSKQEGHLFDPSSVIGLSANDSTDFNQRISVNQTISGYVGPHFLSLALEASDEQYEFDDELMGLKDHWRQAQRFISLTDEWELAQWALYGNVRQQWLQDVEDSQQFKTYHSYHLGARSSRSSAINLKANITQQIRVPSVFEQFGNGAFFVGNDELIPETAVTYDIGVFVEDVDLLKATWSLELAGFFRDSENTIAPEFDSRGVGRFHNIANATYKGLEWQGEAKFGAGQSWAVSYSGSYQLSETEADFDAYDDKQVPGYYPISTQLDIQKSFGSWQVASQWLYEDGLYYERTNLTDPAPTKSVTNFSVKNRLVLGGFNGAIELVAHNIFDVRYMDYSNKVMPGRQFFISFELSQNSRVEEI